MDEEDEDFDYEIQPNRPHRSKIEEHSEVHNEIRSSQAID